MTRTDVLVIVIVLVVLWCLTRRKPSSAVISETSVNLSNTETGEVYRTVDLPDGTQILIPRAIPQMSSIPGVIFE